LAGDIRKRFVLIVGNIYNLSGSTFNLDFAAEDRLKYKILLSSWELKTSGSDYVTVRPFEFNNGIKRA